MADDSESDSELPSFTAPINFTDPFTVYEGTVQVRMQFPEPGVYFCELVAGEDEEVLMSRRIVVVGPDMEKSDGQ
jgi:hypothetical protein